MTDRRIRVQLSDAAKAVLDTEAASRQPGDVLSEALLAHADNSELRAVAEHLRETAELAVADRDVWKERFEVLEKAVIAQARFVASVGHAINTNATTRAIERVRQYEEADEVSDRDLDYYNSLAEDPEFNKDFDWYVRETVKKIGA